ncbi:protein piccolo isoform X4 [Crotalus tigris]|uniref:protein piccolo isoform X4 n=1 Tax=Crotalus tigris TaxID=88082 RepID=UPI00192F16B9|nr:protein piccolo isoform X4 [Crotalus tigris]
MGNEASLEGGESLAGLPEGVAGAAAGDPVGLAEDLSRLSPEERRQIAAVMSRAQRGLPAGKTAGPEAPPLTRSVPPDDGDHPKQQGKPPDPGPPTLSKSRTADTLKTEQQVPGRSTSSMSLRESKSKTDLKDDQKPTIMPSFLSDANPFGAVTSVVNKFNPFDLISDSDIDQNEGSKRVKPTQKEQGKSEPREGISKQPPQHSSPKPSSPQLGAVKLVPQKTGPPKQALQRQPQSGMPKQSQKPGSGQTTEEAKQYPGPPTSRFPKQESTKPAKSSPQQSGAGKPPSMDLAKTSSQSSVLKKPASQQGVPPSKPKPQQQPEGPLKPEPAASSKQPLQHLAGPAKAALPQPGGSGKQPSQQPGAPAKPPPQPAESTIRFQQQAGPAKPDDPLPGPSQQQHVTPSQPGLQATKKTFCPLCTTTELLLHVPEMANYNTCTQCQTIVCSLCGFNPNPHITEIKEWLCLNCQMQRALGTDLAPARPSAPRQETPATAASQPQPGTKKKESALKQDATKSAEQQKPPTQAKQPPAQPGSSPAKAKALLAEPRTAESAPKSHQAQPSGSEDQRKQPGPRRLTGDAAASEPSGQNGPEPLLPRRKAEPFPRPGEDELPRDKPAPVDKVAAPGGKTFPQGSPQKSGGKLDPQLGTDLNAKGQKETEAVRGVKEPSAKAQPQTNPMGPDAKLTPKGQPASTGAKPGQGRPQVQAQPPPRAPESAKHFGLHTAVDAPRSLPTAPPETVTGKLFGFGASIFSQASSLITTGGQPGAQVPGAAPSAPSRQPPPPALQKEPPSPSPRGGPTRKEAKPPVAEKRPPKEAICASQPEAEKKLPPPAGASQAPLGAGGEERAGAPEAPQGPPEAASVCPLCETGLNVGSGGPPNHGTCTECKAVVCSLCGFNPTPHITEVQEWLCLNCQTQRALSGQLGDIEKITSPVFPKSSVRPSNVLQSQSKPAELPQQKISAKPALVPEKPKMGSKIQKEDPKAKKDTLSTKTFTGRIQEEIFKIDISKLSPGKLAKTTSADKIIQGISKAEKEKLGKSSSADQILKTESKLPIIDKLSHDKINLEQTKISLSEDSKHPQIKLAREETQKGEPAIQVKLPSADQSQTDRVTLKKIPSADKILQDAQKPDRKVYPDKMTKVASDGEIVKVEPKFQQAKLAKILSFDQIQKEDSKRIPAKIMKTASADQLFKDSVKFKELKQVKLPRAGPESSETISSQRPPSEASDHFAKIEHAPKQEQSFEEKPDSEMHLATKQQEDPTLSEMISKAHKLPEENLSDRPVSLPKSYPVESVREKTEKEDDKSDISSSQQPKSPQGLSDTGYSSDGVSSSLGEIPSLTQIDEKDALKGSFEKESLSQGGSPVSPSDLAKLESTVLSILEAQVTSLVEEKSGRTKDLSAEPAKASRDTALLPVASEPLTCEEEDLRKLNLQDEGGPERGGEENLPPPQKGPRQVAGVAESASTRRQRYDSVEDSSESENSPAPRRRRRRQTSAGSSSSDDEGKAEDSPASGDDENFIRKQIMEMSADEDASGSEDEEYIRKQLKEISANETQKKEEVKFKKGIGGKHKRISRKSSAGYEEESGRRHSWHDDDDDEAFDESPEPKYRETKSQESEEITATGGGGLRRFKTIELNSTITNKFSEGSEAPKRDLYFDEEPELEMESLTDSPEDRSRGEGSSSLHASSFTPGTSPTSVSSFDEDSDSSPSHKKMGGETKQQRKARHRTHGPLLPTIEDSSEEEELREEEELLKEQEKQRELEQQQRKSSSKKSKRDKDELRAQRRRERPKTPPSNLSPIEDASPTEELRQAAEMEELHRSSCSEYSPSIESDPEAFEISPEKIIEVQKVYKLPTAVSLYSPTEEPPVGMAKQGNNQKTLKSAEEVYEEMLQASQTARPLPGENEREEVFEKEPLYGGMLIEDYIYESLVEDAYNGESNLIVKQEECEEFSQEEEQKTPPEEIYEESMQKPIDLQDAYYRIELLHSIMPQEDIVSSSYIMPESHEIVVLDSVAPSSSSDEKQLLEAEAVYEELMKRQGIQLTPGSSPTQSSPELASITKRRSLSGEAGDSNSLVSSTSSTVSDTMSASPVMLPIPDVKITQHFTVEETEDNYFTDYAHEVEEIISQETSTLTYSEALESATPLFPSETCSLTSSTSSVYTAGTPSPVAGSDGITPICSDSVDALSGPSDSEGVVSVAQSTRISQSEEYEPLTLSPKKEPKDLTDASQGSVTFPETNSFASTSVETKSKSFVHAALAEDGKAGRDVAKVNELKRVSEDGYSRISINMAGIKAISDQEFTCVVPLCTVSSITPASEASPAFIAASQTYSFLERSFVHPAPPYPPPPPPAPPILPKPAIYPKKKPPVKTAVTTVPTMIPSISTAKIAETSPVTKICTPTPPPVPPKPALIPAGLVFAHRSSEIIKPPIAPKPAVPQLPVAVHKPTETQFKPASLPFTSSMTLNLVSPAEYKLTSPTSPSSPHSNKSSPRLSKSSQETYVVITLPSEPGTPMESIISQAVSSWPSASSLKEQVPEAIQMFMPSVSSLQMQSTTDQSKSIPNALNAVASIPITTTGQPIFGTVPKSTTEVITARTTVSLVRNAGLDSVSITMPPDTLPVVERTKYRENGRSGVFGDVMDLRTLTKTGIDRTDSCIDLSATPADVRRQTMAGDTSGQSVSTVQPGIINLSTVSMVSLSLAPVADAISVVTCASTVGYSTSIESLIDLGHGMTTPLQLTTSKHFEPGPVITGRQALSADREDAPINLSLGTPASALAWATTKPITAPPVGVTNGCVNASAAHKAMDSGVVDLSITKSYRTMVTVDETTSGFFTTVIEEDEKPVDLTAGKRAVCCDVIYKLPFGRSCTAPAPATTLPEDRFGYRDDHYQYDRSGPYAYRGTGGMKPSMSDTNLSEAGLYQYKNKNALEHQFGAADLAVDLTSGRDTTGEIMDYSSKITDLYPESQHVISGISAPQYSQARMFSSLGTSYGSVLRSSNGVVYSSVAAPVPSTFAITTQPGSIFSTSVRDLPSLHAVDSVPSLSNLPQSQALPRSLHFLTTVSSEKDNLVAGIDPGMQPLPLETIATEPVLPVFSTASEAFIDGIEDEGAVLIDTEEDKQQHLDIERELLELEKLKQQRFAEELEWERQEIQRFREQEQFMVQKKLEELHSMKHHLLYQQEEERQAQFMMRQETLAQQQLHIEQIQQLQQQLHQHLEEQKIHQMYQYNYDPSEMVSPQTTTDQVLLDSQYAASNQFWPGEEVTTTTSALLEMEIPDSQGWYAVQSDGMTQYIPKPGTLSSVSELSLKDMEVREEKQLKKKNSMPKLHGLYEERSGGTEGEPRGFKKIVESGVQTDDEDSADLAYADRRRRTKKSVDTSVQTDDEDQDEWDPTNRSRRKTRVGKYEGSTEVDKAKPFSKVSSIAVQTVAEISVQTEPVGTIRTPSARAQLDAKIEIVKHISAPEKTYKGGSLGCQTETDSDTQSPLYHRVTSPQKDKKRPTPLEIGYSSHLHPETTFQMAPSAPKSPKVLYSPISPVPPAAVMESAFVPYEKLMAEDISSQKTLHADIPTAPQLSPKSAKVIQRSLSDPKPLSPTAEDLSMAHFQYTESFLQAKESSGAGTSSGPQKKVKRTLPNPPPEDVSVGTQPAFSTVGSISRRRMCRSNTMARAKILQDIDRELDMVERESAKLRKKQAELDEEEKEIDAKLRYLEMGINRRKEALLKEREKRERAYLQGVAEERDYMSDSEVSSTRPARAESQHGLERPRTAPQTEFDQFIPPQTQPETQFATPTSPYTQYQYSSPALPTQAPTPYTQQSHYQQPPPLYQQQVSPYQTQTVVTVSFTPQAQPPPTLQPSYQLSSPLVMIPQKARQTSLYMEPKITTNYDVIRNPSLMIAPASSDSAYSVAHLGSKYSTLDLRLGLDERSSLASSPISSLSGDSFYPDVDHHSARSYLLLDDMGDLTKETPTLSSTYGLHEKDLGKTDRLLRATEARRVQEVPDFLSSLQTSSRLHSYMKTEEDPMEDPYELKLLKHQIKQEFRRGAESMDHLAGLSHCYHTDTNYRHFPKSEKYSISRLTLEKQAAKQLPAALLYQKQSKHKKALMDPKLSKFSPIQESRDLELDYSTYLTSNTSSVGSITSKAKLLQDDITFGLRKNITDQQKYIAPTLSHSLGTSLGAALSVTMRSALQDDVDKSYASATRSRPSSRPSSVYGLDLSLKRDTSSSSLRLKAQEAEPLDVSFSPTAPSGRTKPTSLPISQSRGRIPIVAQNSEEESPLSPVGQPMGMARAAAGPLPPISADTRDQFGSSHSLPEVQQHMREESRARGYDRDIAFFMDDFQHAMSDSEAYHLRREETDWFDKPREPPLENGPAFDRRLPDKLAHSRPPSQHQDQIIGKPIQYTFPHARLKLLSDPKDHSVSGNGLGIRIVGGKEIPGTNGEIGAYIARILPGGNAEQTGKLMEGMQVLEWNGFPLMGKTYEEVQSIIALQSGEAEICVRLNVSMLSEGENSQHLEWLEPGKTVDKTKSPGVDPKQLAAELQKVSLQQAPLMASSAMEKGSHGHSGTASAASSSVPSPGQPGSPSVSKKRHSGKSAEVSKGGSHPITGEIQLQINYDKQLGNLIIHVLQARNLAPRDNNGYSDPFVKVYLLPGRGQVMVVQNASVENKRKTKYLQKSLNPEWNQTVIYKSIFMEQLKKKTLEVSVWDYDRFSSNDFLGEVLIELSSASPLDNTPRWYVLKEQSENFDHGRSHSGQGSQQSPKPSVIKSRSHGIFPDPSKDMQMPTIEKSHSSPGSSKSSSEGHLRSHGPSRSQSKTSVTQTHLEDAGAAIAAAEAAVQQLRLQPTRSANHRPGESSVSSTGSSTSTFGSGYSVDSEGSNSNTTTAATTTTTTTTTTGDSNHFPIPRIGKMSQNGQEAVKQSGVGLKEIEGKTQVMGEIKIALKKEMKTDGEQLIVEILQCRNITYKFKSPDHLPDLYVKLYVVNLGTQKRVVKKKTRVCRHDREPSFNETFRLSLSPSGHSLQILLVSNGGKFMKKTLIGEAYIWLDKVDLRKRIVNWHKLLVSSTQAH